MATALRRKSSSGVRAGQILYADGRSDGRTDATAEEEAVCDSATRPVERVGRSSRHAQLCGPVFTSIATFLLFVKTSSSSSAAAATQYINL